KRCNAIVLGWILSSLSPDLYLGQVYSQIASEVWDELQETYDKMDGSVIFNVINKIYGLKQGDLSVPEYYHKPNSLWREFDTLTLLPVRMLLMKAVGNFFVNSNGKVYNNNTEAPKGASTSSGSTSFDTQFTKEQMMKILSLINEKPSGNANANMVVLFDVLIIPDYNVSLMSVHKLIKDSKLYIRFDETKCYIQDLNLVKTLGTGSEADGLYLFDMDQIGKSVVGCANSTLVCHISKQLWHSRLGHPADHVLSVLSKSIGLKYKKHVSPCDICHKAKQTREPFPLSDHKSLSVRDLVHLTYKGLTGRDVVLRESYKPKTRGKLYYACPLSKERVRILVGSSRASTTPSYSPGPSTTLSYSLGPSTTLSHSPGPSTPSYSPGPSRNAKHEYKSKLKLLKKIDNSNDPVPKVRNDDEREHSTGDGNVMASHDVNSSHPIDENATFATPLNENINSSEGQQSDSIPPRFNSDNLCSTDSTKV
nr:ribonuclease H-like domain-containing protein [Tanacetum cinerariifolium]